MRGLRSGDAGSEGPLCATDLTVAALLAPYPSGSMECYSVSPVVNNARNETVACVELVQQRHSERELKINANETPLLL